LFVGCKIKRLPRQHFLLYRPLLQRCCKERNKSYSMFWKSLQAWFEKQRDRVGSGWSICNGRYEIFV